MLNKLLQLSIFAAYLCLGTLSVNASECSDKCVKELDACLDSTQTSTSCINTARYCQSKCTGNVLKLEQPSK